MVDFRVKLLQQPVALRPERNEVILMCAIFFGVIFLGLVT